MSDVARLRARLRLSAILLLVGLLLAPGAASTSSAQAGCTFTTGFADLKAHLGDWMGDPASCEYPDPKGTGDVEQNTTAGLAFWRKSTNTATFTNGNDHWAIGPRGLIHWTGSSIDPPAEARFADDHACVAARTCRPAAAFAGSAASPALSLPGPPPATVSLGLDTPQQIFALDQFGLRGVPDQQPPVLQEPDASYLVFLNGGFGKQQTGINAGHVSLFTTPDFLTYTPVVGNTSLVQPVFGPSCDDRAPSCLEYFDSNYVGANAVFRASNGTDLLMIYNGVDKDFAGGQSADGFYAEIGIARSTDEGKHWARTVDASGTPQAIIQGADPKPTASEAKGAVGTPQPGAIVAGDYIYVFYPYFPTDGHPDAGPPTIQVARAAVAQDGAPGTWTKYYDGSFGSEPGLRPGKGSQVVPTTNACSRPAQPSVAFSTYLNQYVMVFVCEEGWFFSTSLDLVTWSTPTQFYALPGTGEFHNDQPTADNMVLVTPGNPGQTIGQTGYVLYAYTPQWGRVPHELWMRPFTFDRTLPDPIQRCPTPNGCV